MRGQLPLATGELWALRIIPARAGPTTSSRLKACQKPDHPRSCGANRVTAPTSSSSFGSSPLVRGQHRNKLFRQHIVRIIPARAGPTMVGVSCLTVTADHPRSCGANSRRAICRTSDVGSSPLVRGQLVMNVVLGWALRIIPARAGPTLLQQNALRHIWDHPRSCGANAVAFLTHYRTAGSSPLVRGQPACLTRSSRRVRIIPARAGPTKGFIL